MRRTLISVFLAIVAVVAVGAAAFALDSGPSSITKARIERSLPATFANLYVQRAALQGRTGLTPASLHAKTMCDKGGAASPDVGAGSDWNCLMSWTDPEVPMPPEGYGKFELQVHSNGCYTAGAPSKLVGFQTITDKKGRTVNNPAYEFDGCFDPQGDNTPTGVVFPSLLTVTSTTVQPTADHKAAVQISCGTGHGGCTGTVSATAGDVPLGSTTYAVKEEQTATLTLPTALPAGATDVTFTFTSKTGVVPPKPSTIPLQG
ncbi:hypothetical protein [Nocardioides sp. CER19]|uniref:hypothetical protein n=1 Tax=Nocardioides sp. CER19 TaxID=3038538 RepID=UPI0024469B34|nr:hypothetical protein [Nocardioides sp. CER19]MDH2416051.1 hypothetical protein [Nocardioides sp. CER19]